MTCSAPILGPEPKDAGLAVPSPVIHPRRLLLFVTVLVVLFGAFQEMCFRLVFPLPEVPAFNRDFYGVAPNPRPQDGRGGTGNVLRRWESEPDGFAFDHSLNLYGFRGPDFSIASPSDRARIVFVGDSFVEGSGAGDEETIPKQFENALAEQQRVEAINLGVMGVGFPQYLRLVRDASSLLQPRAVFLVTFANDLPTRPLSDEETGPPPTLARRNPWVPRVVEIIRRRNQHVPVPLFYHRGSSRMMSAVPAPDNPLTKDKPPDHIDPQILDCMRRGRCNAWLPFARPEVVEQWLSHDYSRDGPGALPYLEKIATFCQDAHARLIVVYIPHPVATNPLYLAAQNKLGGPPYSSSAALNSPPYRRQQEHLQQVTRMLGIPFLDTTDVFIQAEQTSGRMFWPIDSHCTAAGYRLVASICAQYWIDSAQATVDPFYERNQARKHPGSLYQVTLR